MVQKTRQVALKEHSTTLPVWRLTQMEQALFLPSTRSFRDITVLPAQWRETLDASDTFVAYQSVHVFGSKKRDTFKALLELKDGKRIETVLMKNSRDQYSVCVSTQVGCAMACTFCATGTMGFTRNLTSDEIVDQYRFWMYYLADHPEITERISNVVYMGMGEPLANYDQVKQSLQMLLKYTDLGPTRITVSTVGLVPMLEFLLKDPEWPPVRLAVSLHSADPQTRQEIMPTSYPEFLEKLGNWTKKYFAKFDSKRRHLTFEYIMLSGVNDTAAHAEHLIRFARQVGKVRINLIPYNYTSERYTKSTEGGIARFQTLLEKVGIDVTRRRTRGEDIAAACGQLVVEEKKD